MTSSPAPSRSASSAPRGTANWTPALPIAFLARVIRAAIVASFDRKARAISWVVSPPTSRSVSAARASGEITGWQAAKISPSNSSPSGSSSAAPTASPLISWSAASSRAISACLRSRIDRCRTPPINRRFAAAANQAPGRSGTPLLGQSVSAISSASCASSSARSTSPVIRASEAINRARSMRNTASIARWLGSAAMRYAARRMVGGTIGSAVRKLLAHAVVDRGGFVRDDITEILHFIKGADLDLARPEHRVGTALHPFDRLVHVLDFPYPVTGDQFARFGERPVDHGAAGAVERNPLAERRGLEPVARDQHAGIDQFLVELAHVDEHLAELGRRLHTLFAVLGRLYEHPHTHRLSPFFRAHSGPR